ncbi:MAG: serine/threonine-protein phosphatase [Desulfobacterales bacterium]|nr:serine/threonine-protein phosphatase [Desulfobacterales bacterium]
METRQGNVWGQSHAGYKRTTNEDRFLIHCLPGSQAVVLSVADGMGGEAGGEIAAQIVIDAIEQSQIARHATEQDMTRILEQAGKQIMQKAEEKPGLMDMGTTATVALVHDKTAYWSHVGDSRLYRFRTGFLEQISTDHTFVEDLVAEGALSREEADRHPLRNMLDQCVGCPNLKAESGRFALMPGDRLMLCSDGLTRHLSDRHIQTALESGIPRQTVEVLIDQALRAGGKDNVTVIIMDIGA